MSVVIDDVIRINTNFLFDDADEYTNVYHVKVTKNDSVDDDEFMDVIALEMDDLYTIINSLITDGMAYVDIIAQNITQDVLLPTKAWPVLTVGGDIASPVLPLQIAACVFFRTLRPKTRASKFLPCFTRLTGDGAGVLKTTTQTAVQSFGDSWVAGVVSTLVDADLGAYNAALARFTPVVAAVVPTRFRTQRRRRPGVGS